MQYFHISKISFKISTTSLLLEKNKQYTKCFKNKKLTSDAPLMYTYVQIISETYTIGVTITKFNINTK